MAREVRRKLLHKQGKAGSGFIGTVDAYTYIGMQAFLPNLPTTAARKLKSRRFHGGFSAAYRNVTAIEVSAFPLRHARRGHRRARRGRCVRARDRVHRLRRDHLARHDLRGLHRRRVDGLLHRAAHLRD